MPSLRGIIEGDATPEVFIPQLIDLHQFVLVHPSVGATT